MLYFVLNLCNLSQLDNWDAAKFLALVSVYGAFSNSLHLVCRFTYGYFSVVVKYESVCNLAVSTYLHNYYSGCF